MLRAVRDMFTHSIQETWVDDEESFQETLDFLEQSDPSLVPRVKLFRQSTDLMRSFGIDRELEKALRSKVWLKSGGSLVVNQTEALVAIDVNTGKFVGSTSLEETVFTINLEAVRESFASFDCVTSAVSSSSISSIWSYRRIEVRSTRQQYVSFFCNFKKKNFFFLFLFFFFFLVQLRIAEKRQNVFDDLYAVSEDLITKKITSPKHLGVMGGSNGGLLVGVAFTQRPDLYNAVVCQVPLLDMQRYNKLLAGASWMGEFGNPDIPEEWEYIKKYSPYQNLKEGDGLPRSIFWYFNS